MCSCTRLASTSKSPLSRRRVGTPRRSLLYLGCCSAAKLNQVRNAPRCGKVAATKTLNHRTSSQKPTPGFRGARALSLGSTISVGLPATTHGGHRICSRHLNTAVMLSVRSNFLQRYTQLDLALDPNDLARLNGFNVREAHGHVWQEVFQTIRLRTENDNCNTSVR
jgi:hypothetical protein